MVTRRRPADAAAAVLDGWPIDVSHDLDSVIPESDVVYLLRMQRERMTDAMVPSLREYTSLYGLTPARAADLLQPTRW